MSNPSDFVIKNGVLKQYAGPGGDVIIPNDVTAIGDCAFFGCENLTNVTIPNSVTSIGKSAFFRCDGLKSLTIPEGVTSIGKEAFFRCEGLESVTLPDSVENFGKDAFFGCHCLISIPHWAEGFSRAVGGNDSLPVCTEDELSAIPAKYRPQALLGFLLKAGAAADAEKSAAYREYAEKNVGKLLKPAFEHQALLSFLCAERLIPLKDLDSFLAEAETRGDIEQKAMLLRYQNETDASLLADKREKKERRREVYTEALLGRIAARDPAASIKGLSFVITGELKSWPSRKEIQPYLESYGAKLSSSVTNGTDYLVSGDKAVDSEKRRKAEELGVEVISEEEFNDMIAWRFKNVPEIAIPAWVKTIPDKAFENCTCLSEAVIPNGVTSIGLCAFAGCKNLRSVVIPESVESIGDFAFDGCSSLLSVEIAEGAVTIGIGAFRNCGSLTSVTIPASMAFIGDFAFLGCEKLEQAVFRADVDWLLPDAFMGCSSLRIIAPAGSNVEKYAKENSIPFRAE